MRLIDGTIQALPMSNYILERKETFIRVLENGDNDFLFAMLMEYFDEQPTAYDTEEVVAQLEHDLPFIEADDGGGVFVNRRMAIDAIRKGGVE